MNGPSLVWFRRDLRLSDNPALTAALERGAPVVPVFIWAPRDEGDWSTGAASRVWLHDSLRALRSSLRDVGVELVVRKGPTFRETLVDLVLECSAGAVFWNRLFEPFADQRDMRIEKALQSHGIEARHFNGSLLHRPSAIRTNHGSAYTVFTPFWRKCLQVPRPEVPLPAPHRVPGLNTPPGSVSIRSLELRPRIPWDAKIRDCWTPGEEDAERRLRRFVEAAVARYSDDRDRPDLEGVSRLSAHLHFGEISARRIVHVLDRRAGDEGSPSEPVEVFRRQIYWREFAHHLLHHFGWTTEQPLRPEFQRFPWRSNPQDFEKWQGGRTGYPIVDAGMRQLWETGWMHNRVRMIVASFLVKDLLIRWNDGAEWFWDTLVDADLANNTLGWQWSAGCGADAVPYFRVFNPVTQAERFDPEGAYVRRWIPELGGLSRKWIHRPWEAPTDKLSTARVRLGGNYPVRCVDHAQARVAALAAFRELKSRP